MKKIVLLGAGGNCKVIIDSIQCLGQASDKHFEIVGFLDDDELKNQICGYNRLGKLCDVDKYCEDFVFVNTIGNNQFRKEFDDKHKNLKHFTVISPSAIISPSVQIGEGAIVMPGVIINAGAIIGRSALINTGTIVEHDNKIGNYTHLASGTTTAGNVTIGEGSMLGTGTKVIQGINIGRNVIIGAGAVVIHDIPSGCTAVGVPAKVVKGK